MKYLFIIFFVSFISNAQDLKKIRSEYPKAVQNVEITTQLDGELAKVNPSNKPVLLAYKGAVSTLKAKFAKARSDKKEFFKEGISLIESAVKADGSNIEIRYIRMSVQENSPRFLGYHKNIDEDKEFILKNYKTISSTELKELVKDFVLKSENFSETEKAGF
ncbi:MAG TPA: hypothetical protein PKH16_11145 [Aequorivita sp.]|jgi:hypothetical protein|nr:hypothetical protein [Aequorivita sp.]MBP40769.1 hypothetical protein [Aequorivita sp.]HBC05133.1 hypothetical protein [Aequorivita sp.]HNP68453.1 hypothetical protein [Aequorivita sp.]|tara:strand:- start:19358 stop:19843 length:486 start_codon:yes stop_codon:yes gene_type:complete